MSNLNIKQGMIFCSIDGDKIGQKIGRAVIANDIDELHNVSARIDAAQDYIDHWCQQVGGIKISGGGDEATVSIWPKDFDKIEALRKGIETSFGYTVTVGVGKNLSEAGLALLIGKIKGKNRVVRFNKSIKEDIKKAKRRVREKRATLDEQKIVESYLSKAEHMGKTCELHKKELHKNHIHILHKHEEGFHNSPADREGKAPANPDAEDNRSVDCNLCADLDAQENADGTAGMHEGCPACKQYDAENGTTGGLSDCPACKEYDADKQITGGIETDDCPYCQENALNNSNPENCEMCDEYNAAQGTKDIENYEGGQDHPEAFQGEDHICNCPTCPKRDQTDLGVEDQAAQRPDECPQCQEMFGDAVENQPDQTGQSDPNLQGHETAEEVLNLLDQEPGQGNQTPAQEAKKIDNTELPQGDQMKGNASVKEDFGPAQKNDVSDSEIDMQQGHDCNCPDCPGSQEATPIGELDQQEQPEDGQDEPDMAGVLQSGLDDHAQEQKKQQVLDMVGQTLAGFKANKAQLEATKDQNQALYNSCIQMLKSMISLCDLLGLKPQASPAPAAPTPEQSQPPQQSDSAPAAPAEGAAPGSKTQAG